jgi:hypothetical protein
VIFSEAMIELIWSGRKTQTRRLFQDQVATVVRRNRRTSTTRPFRPVVGKDYAVQPGRGKRARGRILCTGVRMEMLGVITPADIHAEGFHRLDALARYWLELHDQGYPAMERVFCPACLLDADFEYAAGVEPDCWVCGATEELRIKPRPTDAEVLARWQERWARTRVWVITFEPIRLAPQVYLAAQPTRIEADYTMSPTQAVQEPVVGFGGKVRNTPVAAVGIDEIRNVPAAERAAAYDARLDRERALLAQEDRIAQAHARAAANHVSTRSETRVLERLRAVQNPNDDAIERALQALERKAQPRQPQEVPHAA